MAPAGPAILVLAGVNGAGKSSLGGALLRSRGLQFFNPDEAASQIRAVTGCSMGEANSLAWNEGKERLQAAIARRSSHAFESTLGGRTIPALLVQAARAGIDVIIWFVGLRNADQHVGRVRARVAAGGHDIPEELIRRRWDDSRRHLIALMPYVSEIRVFDNSDEGDPSIPEPRLILHWRRGQIIRPGLKSLRDTPEWAKPIVAAALKLQRT